MTNVVNSFEKKSSRHKFNRFSNDNCFREKKVIYLIILIMMVNFNTNCLLDPYSKRYLPFRINSQLQLFKPSVPFPGIFEFSYPKGEFFKHVKPSEDAEPEEQPNTAREFGKKRFPHYNERLFLPNENIDFLSLAKKIDIPKVSYKIMLKILDLQLQGKSNKKRKKYNPEIPQYYKDIFSQYDPNTKFYDKYSERQFYTDMLNFLNRVQDTNEFFKQKETHPNSMFFHDIGKLVVTKLNKYRLSKELPHNISWSEPSYYYMLQHSIDMSHKGELSHDGFDNRFSQINRMYSAKSGAENLACFQSFDLLTKDEIADKFMQLWIDSEGHRLNMVKDFNMSTVAIYKSANNKYWGTMFLMRI